MKKGEKNNCYTSSVEKASKTHSLCLCLLSVSPQRDAIQGLPPVFAARLSRESHFKFEIFSGERNTSSRVKTPPLAIKRCISWSDKALAPGPHTQHPIINKSSRKEAFVTIYLHRFSSSPLISSSENWCTLKLKRRAWQVMVSVITAQISSARVFFSFFFLFSVCNCWNFELDY